MTKKSEIFISDLKREDYSGFNRVFLKYYASLCSYVTTIINDSSVSEDIVQNLFIKLWSDRKKVEIHKNMEHYLFKAAKNRAINYLRSENNRKKKIENLTNLSYPDEMDYLSHEKFLQRLEKCIEQLPERSKEVLLLSRFQKLKQKEIAEKLNISVQTIKNQIWKSIIYLKSCMEQNNTL